MSAEVSGHLQGGTKVFAWGKETAGWRLVAEFGNLLLDRSI